MSIIDLELKGIQLRERYPNRIPIVINEMKDTDFKLRKIKKNKFLVPKEMTMGEFIAHVRKYADIKSTECIYFLVNKLLVPTSQTLGSLDHETSFPDKMLHMVLCKENAFG